MRDGLHGSTSRLAKSRLFLNILILYHFSALVRLVWLFTAAGNARHAAAGPSSRRGPNRTVPVYYASF